MRISSCFFKPFDVKVITLQSSSSYTWKRKLPIGNQAILDFITRYHIINTIHQTWTLFISIVMGFSMISLFCSRELGSDESQVEDGSNTIENHENILMRYLLSPTGRTVLVVGIYCKNNFLPFVKQNRTLLPPHYSTKYMLYYIVISPPPWLIQ